MSNYEEDSGSLTEDAILNLLDNPGAKENAQVWNQVKEDQAARTAMAEFLTVEACLTSDAFAEAFKASEGEQEALPQALQDKLLAISKGEGSEGRERPAWLTVIDGEGKKQSEPIPQKSTWYRGALMAAMVLLAIGGAQFYNGQSGGEDTGQTRLRGIPGEGISQSPFGLLYQSPEGIQGEFKSLSLDSNGHWAAKIPMSGQVQVELQRPQGINLGEAWTGTATLRRQDSDGSLKELGLTPIEIAGDSKNATSVVGKPILLDQLNTLGFVAGDHLVYDVQLGEERLQLHVELTSP